MTKPIAINCKNKYGQYFTPQIIVDYMISISNIRDNSSILEPSSGQGIFIDTLKKNCFSNIRGYEIDKTSYAPVSESPLLECTATKI